MNAFTIATAIIGIYILLALIASNITESISALLDKRGGALFAGVQALVGEATLAKALYGNALMTSLSGPENGTDKLFRREPLPSYVPARTFTLAFLDEVRKSQTTAADGAPMSLPDLVATPDVLLKDLIARIGGLPDGHLKQILTAAVQSSDQTYESLLKSIDTMFDESMQRVSGWYKRWSQVFVAIFGLLLVVGLNIDTVALVHLLANNPTQAQALAASAQQLKPGETSNGLINALGAVPLGWSFPAQITGGWVFMKIYGLLMSWFAVMLGAPFWFDVLKRFVPIRMTGDLPGNKGDGSGKKPADAQSTAT
jgi:hypothetical protein